MQGRHRNLFSMLFAVILGLPWLSPAGAAPLSEGIRDTLRGASDWLDGLTGTTPVPVRVKAPYIDIRTGPGRDYPVFYLAEQGERIELIKRRTDWFKVRVYRGLASAARKRHARTGWISLEQMVTGLVDERGHGLEPGEPGLGDFSRRRWEMGMLAGVFSGSEVMTLYGGYAFNGVLSVESGISQVIGQYSDSQALTLSLLMQPFPRWRLAPFFSLGTGMIRTRPRVTLIQAEDRTDPVAHAGLGARAWLNRRFLLRAEYRRYTLFTTREENQEIDEWKAGIAFFF